jgi:hypothetical protein
MIKTNQSTYSVHESCFEEFRYRLFVESPEASRLFENMIFELMTRVGIREDDALELACRILALKPVRA